jgi:hypothetical protein
VERAGDWLFSHMDDLDSAVAQVLSEAQAASGPAAAGESVTEWHVWQISHAWKAPSLGHSWQALVTQQLITRWKKDVQACGSNWFAPVYRSRLQLDGKIDPIWDGKD